MSKSDIILGGFMHSLTIIRNICAHGGRLYNRLFEQKPSLNRRELTLLITKADGSLDNAHVFGFILIMKRLLSSLSSSEMKQEIIQLSKKYPFVDLKHYGFRADWTAKL